LSLNPRLKLEEILTDHVPRLRLM